MTFKDGIGRHNVPYKTYDDFTDPKVIRVISDQTGSFIAFDCPEGRFKVKCPDCGAPFVNLSFHSVDKVSADMLLPCLTCRHQMEIGDCPVERIGEAVLD